MDYERANYTGYPLFSKIVGRLPEKSLTLDVKKENPLQAHVVGLRHPVSVTGRIIATSDVLKEHLGSILVRTDRFLDIVVPPDKITLINKKTRG